jgi:protein SCO1/2
MSALRMARYGLWLVVAVLIVLIGTYWLTMRSNPDGSSTITSLNIGGPFSLTDQHGAPVTAADLQGHPSALFFGYTYCPDVCPTTLADITVWMSDLGAAADKLKVYFITVDPERDSQEAMANYLKAFDPRIEGLTGSRPAIDQILKDYRVYARKVDGVNGAPYTMDHSATVYLLNDKAQFSGTIDYQEKPEVALAKLKRLTGT